MAAKAYVVKRLYIGTPATEVINTSGAWIGGFMGPMTTLGDLMYGGASGAGTRLAGSTSNSNMFLRSVAAAGVAQAPSWAAVSKEDVTGLLVTSSPQFANLVLTGAGSIKPSVDSTAAIKIANAAGTAKVAFDTTNGRVGIGVDTPTTALDVSGTVNCTEVTAATMATSANGFSIAANRGFLPASTTGVKIQQATTDFLELRANVAYWQIGNGYRYKVTSSTFEPYTDNAVSIGISTKRYTTVYANAVDIGTGGVTINSVERISNAGAGTLASLAIADTGAITNAGTLYIQAPAGTSQQIITSTGTNFNGKRMQPTATQWKVGFAKTGIVSATATALVNVATTNESGDADAGCWTLRLVGHLAVTRVAPTISPNTSVIPVTVIISRAKNAAGAGVCTIDATAGTVADTSVTDLTLGTPTWTAVEVGASEYSVDIKVAATIGGTDAANGLIQFVGYYEFFYSAFSTAPVVTTP